MSEERLDVYYHAISGMEMIVTRLAQEFKRDNPRFDYDKFIDACGLSE